MNNTILKNNNNKPYSIIQKWDSVSVYIWEQVKEFESLNDLEAFKNSIQSKVIFILPFSLAWRQNWYDYIWEEPILAMEVKEEITISKEEILSLLPENEIPLMNITPSISDENFIQKVKEFKEEIYSGNICQGILSRKFDVNLSSVENEFLLSIYKKLIWIEWGYMNYIFDSGNNVFMWASPERHITVEKDEVIKNPIAWTMPKNPETFYDDLIKFLQNPKEENELSMVTDEELKMILKVTKWWIISWPRLRDIAKVIHTEFELRWYKKDWVTAIDCLKETLFSPTIVWWPLESAFNLITKYEWESREHYGTAFWTIDDKNLDTAIPIRSANINKEKQTLSVRAGAWIVEDSNPILEANETTNKALWFLSVLKGKIINTTQLLNTLTPGQKENIQAILEKRKKNLSWIYLNNELNKDLTVPEIIWKKFIIINNWDDFVYMLSYLIEKMWWKCEIIKNEDYTNSNNVDFTLLGPWPWDINDEQDPKMTKLLSITKDLKESWKNVLGICLWHQALCKNMWYKVARQKHINQWKQRDIKIFWKKEKVAFYNSFSPIINDDMKLDELEIYNNDRLFYSFPKIS